MPDSPDQIQTQPGQTQVFDPATYTFKRAFDKPDEVVEVFTRLIRSAGTMERIKKAALIAARWGDQDVFDAKALRDASQDWRHRTSSGWFSSLVKRALPGYTNVIGGLPVLTQASFTDTSESAEGKAQKFRERFTQTVRKWEGWDETMQQTCLENLLYGYATNGMTDELDWRPKFWRIDETFYPDGCKQDPKMIPYWCAKEDFAVHQLAPKLADPETAKAAGWDIENLIKSVNDAAPKPPPTKPEEVRLAEDRARESTTFQYYQEGVKVIEGLHCYMQEPDGSVSYVLLDWRNQWVLLVRRNLFPSMADCMNVFTIDPGNGKIHGSKGMGRLLYNLALQAEQARCVLKDTVYLGALFVLQAKVKARVGVALTVAYPGVVVNENYEVVQNKLSVSPEAFYALDNHFTQVAETLTGQFMPGQITDEGGEHPTATEVKAATVIEQEIRTGIIARFFNQFQALVHLMQRRMFSAINIEQAAALMAWEKRNDQPSLDPRVAALQERLTPVVLVSSMRPQPSRRESPPARTRSRASRLLPLPPGADGQSVDGKAQLDDRPIVNDEEAVKCIIDLVQEDSLTLLEVFELGLAKPNADMPGDAEAEANMMGDVLSRFANDPDMDRRTIKRIWLEKNCGVDLARIFMLPGIDQTVIAEQTRQQLIELMSLMQGVPIPVSPRDTHLVHLNTMEEKGQQFFETLASAPPQAAQATIALGQNLMDHFEAHIQGAKGANVAPLSLQPFEDFATKGRNILLKAQQAVMAFQAAHQSAMGQAPTLTPPGSSSTPPPAPGAPPTSPSSAPQPNQGAPV